MIDAQQVVGTLQFWIGRQILFGTTSWRRTCESLRVAFPHVSHRFTLFSLFWEAFWLVVFGFVCFGLCFVFALFWKAPTLSRCRSFLLDLMTVRAVIVKIQTKIQNPNARNALAVKSSSPNKSQPTQTETQGKLPALFSPPHNQRESC